MSLVNLLVLIVLTDLLSSQKLREKNNLCKYKNLPLYNFILMYDKIKPKDSID